MTESLWQTCPDALLLLDFLFPVRGFDSTEPQGRKSRLYLIACARRAWDRLPWVCRVLVEVAERLADGQRTGPAAVAAAEALVHTPKAGEAVAEAERLLAVAGVVRPPDDPRGPTDHDPRAWVGLAHLVYFPFSRETPYYPRVSAQFHCADLVREVFGNPVRVVALDPEWRTSTAVALAATMYERREFSAMPLLADALQDAGCHDEAILHHCRAADHARGCWVLDLVLGRRG